MTSEYCYVKINDDNNCTDRLDVLLLSYQAHVNAPIQKLILLHKPTLSNEHLASKAAYTQWAFTCSKLTIETLEEGVKYVSYEI